MVHEARFFLPGPLQDPEFGHAMRIFDFSKQEWTVLDLRDCPLSNVLLGVHEHQLVQFAGAVSHPRFKSILNHMHSQHVTSIPCV